jgi:4'-phosphopantetheinyl transferase
MFFPSPHPDILCLLQSLDDAPGLANAVAPAGLLSAEERERHESFRVLKRRRDWLLGRWTAKNLLREHLNQHSIFVPLDQIVIRADEDGSPYALLSGQRLPVNLSISHSGAHSLCALTDDTDARVGADIEVIEPRPMSLAEQFFTEEELTAVLARPEAERDARITLVWSAKEAFLKCTKEGLRVDTRAISVELPELLADAGDWQTMRVSPRVELMRVGTDYRAWWRRDEDAILTLGMLRQV